MMHGTLLYYELNLWSLWLGPKIPQKGNGRQKGIERVLALLLQSNSGYSECTTIIKIE
jgi:hypothetical protein